jgi:hypothetical protein
MMDTILPEFQIFNPIYDYSFSNSYLSNLGTPVMQNVFADRNFRYDAFYINSYMPYFADAGRTKYYNTTRPFSRLLYTTGGPNENREQTFEAVHTQNITQKLNFALRYHVISSKGQYRYQQLKKNTFEISTNYLGTRYSVHASFDINRVRHDESGGIDQEAFESNYISADTSNYTGEKDIPATFSGSEYPQYVSFARTKARYYDMMVSQRLKLFTLASSIDTTKPGKASNVAEPVLTHSFRMNRATKTYTHADPNDTLFYEKSFFNYFDTYDSVSHFRISNSIQLEFKTTFRGVVQTGIYGTIGNEYEFFHLYSDWDTTQYTVDTLRSPIITGNDTLDFKGYDRPKYNSNYYFTAGLYGNVLNRFKARFSGTLYFIGEKAGNSSLEALISTTLSLFNKEYIFDLSAGIENNVPSYLLSTYYSNHYIWDNKLSSELRTILSGKLNAPSNNFDLRINYYLLSSFIYFDEGAMPANYGQPLNVLSIVAAKTFKIWKLRSVNKIAYQATENSNVLPLPGLVLFNSTYLDHTFHFQSTGGKFQAVLGFDIYYTTEFEGYKYSPALAQFYVQGQNKALIGNYPIMDAFLSIKLKSTEFFVKAEHFYGRWTQQKFYSTVAYPYNRYALKFGFSWTFYD